MFLGALEIETAVVEARDADRRSLAFTHGAFARRRPALVVDLVDIPEVPSLFDAEHRHLRSAIGFLRNFTLEVSRPSARDGRIHIEYVPTQIVTEWLRARFAPGEGRRPDGVLCGSARNPGGANLALFIDNSGACDVDGGLSGAKEILVLREQHRLHGGVPSPRTAG